jgi:hypothetical protein
MPWWRRDEPRTTGRPPSANGASSFHLRWGGLPPGAELVEVAVTLEVVTRPVAAELYFWALQAGFAGPGSRRLGAAHLGLQWYPPHPGSTAVNWGGYAAAGGILEGTESALPSATGNPNTRDLWWEPGRSYTLTIEPAAEGGWAGTIDGIRVRRLDAGGDRLSGLMVWSEVFARCDAPPVAAHWSGFRAITTEGGVVAPVAVYVNYQSRADGGCDNSTVLTNGHAVSQITGTERLVPQGARLPLGAPPP